MFLTGMLLEKHMKLLRLYGGLLLQRAHKHTAARLSEKKLVRIRVTAARQRPLSPHRAAVWLGLSLRTEPLFRGSSQGEGSGRIGGERSLLLPQRTPERVGRSGRGKRRSRGRHHHQRSWLNHELHTSYYYYYHLLPAEPPLSEHIYLKYPMRLKVCS